MKRIFTMILAAAVAALAFVGCEYDDDKLWNKVNDIDDRLTELEEKVGQMNEDIKAMDVIVKAIETGNTITAYAETADGYTITFDDGETITIKHGSNGAAGADGLTLGVKEYEDGHFYWTQTLGGVTTGFPSEADKLRVTGDAGATPELGVDADGYWTVTINGVTTQVLGTDEQPVKAEGVDGDNGTAGDSFFSNVVDNGDSVTFVLSSDGTEITVDKKVEFKFVVDTQGADEIVVKYTKTKALPVMAAGVEDYLVMSKPAGWDVSYADGLLSITAPAGGNPSVEYEGEIGMLVVSRAGASMIVKVKVKAVEYVTHTITFEGNYWEPFVAANYNGATYTSNVLNTSWTETYTYPLWKDPATSLTTLSPTHWEHSDNYGQGYGFDYPWMLSSYNSNNVGAYGDYTNDLYVYNPTNANATKGGGNNGSDNFVVSFGYNDTWGDFRPIFTFADGQARTIRSLYVNSTCYFFNAAGNGNALSPALSEDDKVILYATGYDAAGNELGTKSMLFADYDNFILEWTEWNLSDLGPVVTLRLNQGGDTDNGYGYSLPAYYAVDDITVIVE